jgi:hypothetical protein
VAVAVALRDHMAMEITQQNFLIQDAEQVSALLAATGMLAMEGQQ